MIEEALKREDNSGRWDGARITGVIFIILSFVPFLVWLYELLHHVVMQKPGDFNPALNPMDMWFVVITALGIGLGLSFGYGREIANAVIDRIKGNGED